MERENDTKSWSKDQKGAPARSSEVGLYAAITGEGMGLASLAKDWACSRICLSDASATKGILELRGLWGKYDTWKSRRCGHNPCSGLVEQS